MNKTTLQIPINSDLKTIAEDVASEQGFSSLQEVIRVFLTKFAARKIEISWQEPIYLSKKNEKRYSEMTEDFQKNKKSTSVNGIHELLDKLNEDKIS